MDIAKKHRVLIFPAGSEIGLEIHSSLKYSHHVEIFGASGKSDHASFIYEPDHYVEDDLYVDQPDFIERFNRLLDTLEIDFVYPTHDTIANFLAAHQAGINARVLTSCAETNRIARMKRDTYELFRSFDFCPEVFAQPYRDMRFPVFLKPNDGQGGKGTHVAETQEDLDFYLKKDPGLLVTEFLPGEELSVDCFTTHDGRLLFIGPRTRERIQMGISFRSTAVEATDEIKRIAQCINETVALDGAWFFQVKKDRDGRFKLMEFAPRQSSTMGLFRHKGVNFALLTLFNALGVPVAILQNDYAVQLDRSLRNRFKADLSFRRVYIDFDETLVVGRRVHELAMAFLYQCRNRGIQMVLLTKHRYDIRETLRACGISEHVFEEIIQISESEDKSTFIDPAGAIFIDNYWFDRHAVKTKLGIPVFDVDGIECLLR
ncbi:carbamoylphosphate synthase large subunit short form [Cupriavidus sp. TA19]|uniref:ATP-grasp domain-containing protein n=1 Tax=unclassified Cupriavidus TaxID=2640874 RepID=UPI00272941AC|nr:ATP-grasp domain-containing protein [Cupriavidus sp. TA19]GLC94530.1 carbamoylphosphate synthase large subunit short form [Cupriavidus sp. TA19]